MAIRSILFDLDDTLIVEGATADAAFLATCEHAHEKYGIDPEACLLYTSPSPRDS